MRVYQGVKGGGGDGMGVVFVRDPCGDWPVSTLTLPMSVF